MATDPPTTDTGKRGARYTFDDGTTVPFRVICPPMPDPIHLIATTSAHDRVVACVPEGQDVPRGRRDRFLAFIRELDCVHDQPAIVMTRRDESLALYCPECQRRNTLRLRAPELGSPDQERAARQQSAHAWGLAI